MNSSINGSRTCSYVKRLLIQILVHLSKFNWFYVKKKELLLNHCLQSFVYKISPALSKLKISDLLYFNNSVGRPLLLCIDLLLIIILTVQDRHMCFHYLKYYIYMIDKLTIKICHCLLSIILILSRLHWAWQRLVSVCVYVEGAFCLRCWGLCRLLALSADGWMCGEEWWRQVVWLKQGLDRIGRMQALAKRGGEGTGCHQSTGPVRNSAASHTLPTVPFSAPFCQFLTLLFIHSLILASSLSSSFPLEMHC